MNKRKFSAISDDSPRADQKLITLSKKEKESFAKKFPYLTRDALYIGTYAAVLPVLFGINDIALCVIECLFDGVFSADSSNVGGVELIDSCFDASDEKLKGPNPYQIALVLSPYGVSDVCDIMAGQRGIVVSIPATASPIDMFWMPGYQLKSWHSTQEFARTCRECSLTMGPLNGTELLYLSRVELKSARQCDEYVSFLPTFSRDIDTRIAMLTHACASVPLSDKDQSERIQRQIRSLADTSHFIKCTAKELSELSGPFPFPLLACQMLSQYLDDTWYRLKMNFVDCASDMGVELEIHRSDERMECTQGTAFRFVTTTDKWIVSQKHLDIFEQPEVLEKLERKGRVLKRLASSITKACEHCLANVVCPFQ